VNRLRDLDRRAARHVGSIVLAAVTIGFVGSAVHLVRYDPAGSLTRTERPAVPAPDAAGGSVAGATEVGPRIGEDLASYVEERADVLGGLAADEVVRAVVSFTSYRSADEVSIPEGVALEAAQLRVPIVDVLPVQVTVSDGDLIGAVARAVEAERAALEQEARDLESTLASDIGDLDFEADFEQRLAELSDLDGVVPDAPVVFAVVVSATASDLRTLSASDGIRLVDPGGPQQGTERTRFYGLLPDDDVRASHGRSL
jgi:hypothetical protein